MEKTLEALKKIVYWPTRIIFFVYPVLPFLYGFSWQSVDSFSRANFPLPLALKIGEVYLRAVQIGAPLFLFSALIQIFFFKRTLWKVIVPLFALLFCAFFGFLSLFFGAEIILSSATLSGEKYYYTEFFQWNGPNDFWTYATLYKCNIEARNCIVIDETQYKLLMADTKLLANEERDELYLFEAYILKIFKDSQYYAGGHIAVEEFTDPSIYLVVHSSEPVFQLYQCDEARTACTRLPFKFPGSFEIYYPYGQGNPETKDFFIYLWDDEAEDVLLVYSYLNGIPRCHIEGCTLGDE